MGAVPEPTPGAEDAADRLGVEGMSFRGRTVRPRGTVLQAGGAFRLEAADPAVGSGAETPILPYGKDGRGGDRPALPGKGWPRWVTRSTRSRLRNGVSLAGGWGMRAS